MNLRKKEKYANYSKWIWRNPFCCCSNLSNDDIICYILKGWVWEWVWILEARSENGCEKWHFFLSEIGSGFGEPGRTPPPKIATVWIFINFATQLLFILKTGHNIRLETGWCNYTPVEISISCMITWVMYKSKPIGRFPFSQNFRNFRFGGEWNTFHRFVPLENSQKKCKI